MGMPSHVVGITALVARLEEIRAECTVEEDNNGAKKKVKLDDFTEMKRSLLSMLHIVRRNLCERARIIKKSGNNYQAIEKAARIRDMLNQIESCLPKFQQMQLKASAKLHRSGRAEEDVARIEDIRILTRQVEECKQSLRSNNLELESEEIDALWGIQPGGGNVAGPNGGLGLGFSVGVEGNQGENVFRKQLDALDIDKTGRDLTAAEKDALQRWNTRDQEFDHMLDQISVMCDRLNPIMREIGVAAQRQTLIADDLSMKVQRAEVETKTLGARMHTILEKEQNSDFICKIVMFMVLLCILGIVAQQINNYY